MKQSWEEMPGTLCSEETFRWLLSGGVLGTSEGPTVPVSIPVPVACIGAVWGGRRTSKMSSFGSDVTTTIVFPTHGLRLPKPLRPSCHRQEQFALFSKSYTLTYRKLPLFVSKIVFVSHTFSLPHPSFCDWICFLCDGVWGSHYSPAAPRGNLLFPRSHCPLVCLELGSHWKWQLPR